MAEKKSSSKKSSGRKSSARKSSSRKSTASSAKKTSAKKSSAKKTSARKTSSSAPRKRAAKKGGQARGRQQKAQKQARTAASTATAPAAAAGEFSGKAVAEFRQALTSNLIRPLEMVMLSRHRIEEALEEVVTRGRMTRDDATQLGQALLMLGRQQTDDVMKDLEQLLGRGRTRLEDRTDAVRGRGVDAARGARRQVGQAADAARKAADPLLAQADRARRVAGVGPSFPITGYDDLTAAQIQSRLETLTPAELRKVRDYERRRGNRKSVLEAIEAKLG
jgi:polyhydroxyalkanoate synthesis regulator phasin